MPRAIDASLPSGVAVVDNASLIDLSPENAQDRALRLVAERTAQLQAASAAKSEFLAHMSHEIRTPMNAVISLTQVLKQEALTAEQAEIVRTIDEAGAALLRIINDILDFSRIEAGQLQIEHRPFDLGALLHQVERLLGESAKAKGLRFSVAPPPDGVQKVTGDALRLEQVLVNLVNNAIKFTERGSVELDVTARNASPASLLLRFAVRDTGIGIAPGVIEKLFQPFVQANGGITRRFGGTGLGLAICRHLVELMGGRIGVASKPGEGSTFWFEVTLRRANGDHAAAEAPTAARSTAQQLKGLRVLAVDDNQMNLFVVERILKKEGAAVVLAADGQQALQVLQAKPQGFDVVLMDVQMPVMDGLTATRVIRADPALAHLAVVALTAGVFAEERQKALDAGVDDFLPKPLDRMQMLRMLASIRARAKPKA